MELIKLTLKNRSKQYRVTKLKLIELAERGLKQAVYDRISTSQPASARKQMTEEQIWDLMKNIVASEVGILHGVEPWPYEPTDKPVS